MKASESVLVEVVSEEVEVEGIDMMDVGMTKAERIDAMEEEREGEKEGEG